MHKKSLILILISVQFEKDIKEHKIMKNLIGNTLRRKDTREERRHVEKRWDFVEQEQSCFSQGQRKDIQKCSFR